MLFLDVESDLSLINRLAYSMANVVSCAELIMLLCYCCRVMPTQEYIRHFPIHATKFFLGEKADNWIFFMYYGFFPPWAVMRLRETQYMMDPYDPMKAFFRDNPEAWYPGGRLRPKKGLIRQSGDYPRLINSEYHKAIATPIIDIEYLRQKPHPKHFPEIDSFPTRKYAHLDKAVDEIIERKVREANPGRFQLWSRKFFGNKEQD